jgi:hypothetical protein
MAGDGDVADLSGLDCGHTNRSSSVDWGPDSRDSSIARRSLRPRP